MMLPRPRTLVLLFCWPAILWGMWLLIEASVMSGNQQPDEKIRNAVFCLAGGFGFALLIILFNSGTLTREWLGVVGVAFKGVGALSVVLLGLALWNQNHSRKQYERDAHGLVDDFMAKLVALEDKPIFRLQTVAVCRYTLRNPQLASMALAQAVYTVALTDEDSAVREEAWDVLFPGVPRSEFAVFSKDFVVMLVDVLGSNGHLANSSPYNQYLLTLQENVELDDHFRRQIQDIRRLGEIEKGLIEEKKDAPPEATEVVLIRDLLFKIELAALRSEQSVELDLTRSSVPPDRVSDYSDGSLYTSYLGGDDSFEGDSAMLNFLEAPTPAFDGGPRVVTDVNSPINRRLRLPSYDLAARRQLSKTSVATFVAALASLPRNNLAYLPPHVEIFYFEKTEGADERLTGGQRESSLKLQQALIEQLELIVPKPQRPPPIARPPEKMQVRYFDPSGQTVLENIVELVGAALNLPSENISTYLVKPSDSDLSLYRDMAKHFEIWFPTVEGTDETRTETVEPGGVTD